MNHLSGHISIVGAGIMGLSVAYALRQQFKRMPVFLFESGNFPPYTRASLVAGGMLAPYSEIEHIPAAFTEAASTGIKFWENLPRQETGFVKKGTLLLAHIEDRHMLERFAAHLPSAGNWQHVNPGQIALLEPSLKKDFEHGIYIPEEAFIIPASAMNFLASELIIAGGETDMEDAEACSELVIDCRGYDAVQDDPALRGVKGEIIIVHNSEFSLERPVRLMHPRYPLYIVPRPDHQFAIGATQIESADNSIALKSVMELLSAAYSLHPSFAEAEVISLLSGIRPAYPDNLPRITIDGNIIRCNGLFRHGYLFAPVMAQCVADYIAGQNNKFMDLFLREKNDHHHQRAKDRYKRRA